MKRLWNNSTLKKKMIIYFIATVILMSITNIYSYYSMDILMNKMSITFEINIRLNNLHKTMEKFNQAYEGYLTTKYSKNLDEYYKYYTDLKKESEAIKMDYSNTTNILMMKNIKNMIITYLEHADAAVTARRGRAMDEYLRSYNESRKVYQYIIEYIQKLNNTLFFQNSQRYLSVRNTFYMVEVLNLIIILCIILLNIILITWFTSNIAKPISKLAETADEISHGNFDVPDITVETHDEVGITADAFNRMKTRIRQYINELKEKAELESKLKERELENLKMRSSLKEAELHALQSQINPHFLFNTLNAAAQMAMMEGADRACSFIENAAELFRYNIRNLDKPVTIGDEMNNIENYIYLLKERFSDKVEFSIQKDESILPIKIPCMVLQPIVENAFIHGISEIAGKGLIVIKAVKNGNHVDISIKDNGKGMPQEKINRILREEYGEEPEERTNKGHASGIGIKNVLSRLKLFYGSSDIMDIHSELGRGTEVILHIPMD